jgi:opacity protein-like surface antigen
MKNSRFLFLFFLFSGSISAQHLEAGLMLGTSNYLGDLSNNSASVYLKESNPAAGVFGRYNISEFLAGRFGVTYGMISGQDANSKKDPYILERNLSFRSSLVEASLIAEINFLGYRPYGMYNPFSPYVFAGVAATMFKPQARFQGIWVDLQPLGTEGQGMSKYPDRQPYSLTTLAIPFGLGVKYALTDKFNVGFEIGARRTFTDYLDDVSKTYIPYPELLTGNGQISATLANRTGELRGGEPVIVPIDTPRGDRKAVDWYFITGVTITYNFIDNGLMGSRGRRSSRAGCEIW